MAIPLLNKKNKILKLLNIISAVFVVCFLFANVAFAAPTVDSISPNNGLPTGGTSVTITGTNFLSGVDTDTNTKLLLHGDGTGAAFADSRLTPKTITANGNVTQSAAQSKFGGKSAYFDGSNGYLSLPDSSDWQMGSGSFTLDFWYKDNGAPNNSAIISYGNGNSTYEALLVLVSAGHLFFYSSSNNSSWDVIGGYDMGAYSNTQFDHFAVVRNGNNFGFYKNGTLITSTTSALSPLVPVTSPQLNIGKRLGATAYLNGYVDELRISKGVARWTSNFTPPTVIYGQPNVTLGGSAATNVSVTSSTTITATTPAHAAGATDVVVTNYDGQSATLTNGYTFNAAPALGAGAVVPSSAKFTGGDTITITGSGFYGTPTITLGGIAATNVTVVNPTTITATTPAHTVGQVDVVITNPDTQTATLTNGFTFNELPPTVASISPTSGPAAGGTNVTITGTNFFGGLDSNTKLLLHNDGTGSTFTDSASSPQSIAIVGSPIQSSTQSKFGGLSLSLNGTSALASINPAKMNVGNNDFAIDTWLYLNAPLSTTTVLTTVGPAYSGGVMRGYALYLYNGGNITFDYSSGATATNASFGSSSVLTPSTWHHLALTRSGNSIRLFVDGVQTGSTYTYPYGAGINAASATDYFGLGGFDNSNNGYPGRYWVNGYVDEFRISVGSPRWTSNFTPPVASYQTQTNVSIGGLAATNVNTVNPTTITATTPAHAAGATDVVVTNYDGQSGTLTNGYTFNAPPTISSVSPTSSKLTGGDTITITGSGFYGVPTITLGGTAATNVTVINPTTITATTPAHAVGQVNVVITNPDTQTATFTNGFTFTELPPTVSGISPTSGPAAGGTNVTITGTNFLLSADANTALLLHAEGTGASFVDSETTPKTINASASATQSTTQFKFGGSSAYFNGSSYLTTPTSSDFDPGTSNFTIDTWIYPTTASGKIAQFGDAAANAAYAMYLTSNVVQIYAFQLSGSPIVTSGASLVPTNSWSHVALSRSGSYFYLFINGTLVGTSSAFAGAITTGGTYNTIGTGYASNVGGYGYGGYFNGYIDEFRYSKGIARWTSNFTPPTSAYAQPNVTIGGTSATNIFTTSLTSITATTPAHAAGATDVVVINIDGQSATLTNGYTFNAAPTISSVSPSSAKLTGGDTVTITGTNFYGTPTITLGGTAATNVTVVNPTTITATTSAHTVGQVDVVITNPDTQTATLTNGFTFNELPPTVGAVSPTSGSTVGGTNVTITGTNFLGGNDSYTKLLLHGDGSGASFVDSETIPKTVTANGNVTQSVTQSKFGGKSAYFDGSGDYLQLADSNDWDFGNGDFTIDLWVKRGNTGVRQFILGQMNSAATNVSDAIGLDFETNNTLVFSTYTGTYQSLTTTGTISDTTTWHHIAVVKFNNIVKLYIDGVADSVTLDLTGKTITNQPYALSVGMPGEYNGLYFNGYLDEVRISKGIARWTNNFTYPGVSYYASPSVLIGGSAATNVLVTSPTTITATTPAHAAGATDVVVTNYDGQSATLTNGYTFNPPAVSSVSPNNGSTLGGTNVTITGTDFQGYGIDSSTKLLLHGDGTGSSFVDSETIPKTITANGASTQSSAQSKFGGKSINFNGSSYLSIADSSDFGFGTGDFTLDFWLYPNSVANDPGLLEFRTANTAQPHVLQISGGKLWWYNSGTTLAGNTVINTGQWSHIALVRSSGVVKTYVNGILDATASIGTDLSSSRPLIIGAMAGGIQGLNGYIDELRVSKGVARWTSNFTSPTSQYASSPAVAFGGISATNIAVANSSTITATTPAHAAGATDVVVTNYDGQSGTLTNGYTFNAPPTISSVSPTSSKLTGGDTITITGSGFYGVPTITLGGTAATNVTVINPTTITATTPAHAVGQVNVVITNQDSQTATLTNGFTFIELPPTVGSILPTSGSTLGGTSVTISGTNFLPKNTGGDTGWATVAGRTLPVGLTAPQIAVVGNNLYLYGGYNGTSAVNTIYTATTADPTTWTLVSGKTLPGSIFYSHLAIVGSNMYLYGGNNGSTGTNTIYTATTADPTTWTTVVGKNLPANLIGAQLAIVGNNMYLFGGHSGSLTVNTIYTATTADPTTWTLVSGKTLPVTLAYSQIATVGNNLYIYGGYNYNGSVGTALNAIYTATTADPTTWTTVAGKTLPVTVRSAQLLINGENLYILGGYNDGGSTSLNKILTASISDPTTWTTSASVIPANLSSSTLAVVDNNAYLFSGYIAANTTAIYRVPLTHSRPNSYSKFWLTNWPTIQGYTDQSNVTIGGVPATNINFVNSTTITATTPAHAAGVNDVVVTNYDGQSAALTNGYAFNTPPTISSVSPSNALKTGGDTITISGSGFYGTPTITFGGTAATNVTLVNPTTITATTPSHTAGLVNVVVTNPDSQTATLTNGFSFTEFPPTLSGITPAGGTLNGGTKTTISGTNFNNFFAYDNFSDDSRNTQLWSLSTTGTEASVLAQETGQELKISGPVTATDYSARGFKFVPTLPAFGTEQWEYSVDYKLPSSPGGANNRFMMQLVGPSGQVTLEVVPLGGGYRIEYYNGSVWNFSSSVPLFGNESSTFHKLKILYDPVSKQIQTFVDSTSIATVTNNLGASLTEINLVNQSISGGGGTIDLRFDNFRVRKIMPGFPNGFPSVTFGGVAAVDALFSSPTSISATTPAHAIGATDVVVTNYDNASATSVNGYTYNPAPALGAGAVVPSGAKFTGGDTITITGSNFFGTPTVTLGGTPATNVIVTSPTTLTVTTPAHAVGQVDVVITNPDLQVATLTNGFTFMELPPVLGSVTPNFGAVAGGTNVTISGTNFLGSDTATSLLLHGNGVGSTFVDSSFAPKTVSAFGNATQSATQSKFGGKSAYFDGNGDYLSSGALNLDGDFTIDFWANVNSSDATYDAMVGDGPYTGSNLVVFVDNTGKVNVFYGGVSRIVSTTTIGSTSVFHHVAVVRSAGVSKLYIDGIKEGADYSSAATMFGSANYVGWDTSANTYLTGYIDELRVSKGVARWTSNFTPSTNPYFYISDVTFGGVSASNITFVNSTTITATTPAHSVGAVDVAVKNYDGQVSTLTNGFDYKLPPTLTSVSPISAKLTGGDTVTITGTGFFGTPNITIGGIAATNVTVVNSTTITATTPAHAIGAVDVVITNPDSQTATLASGFTYIELPPTVSSISPTNGPMAGGTNVTITGTNFLNNIDTNTKLLLHNDGIGGSFVDSEAVPKTVNVSGAPTQSTSQSKFGGSSASFDGSSYLSIPDSADFDFGSGDFTIDTWVRFNNNATDQAILSQATATGHSPVLLLYQGSTRRVQLSISSTGTAWAIAPQYGTRTLAINTWHHIAIVRSGSSFKVYVNGTLDISVTMASALVNSPNPLLIGSNNGSQLLNGYIDEFRLSKDIARWSSNFTPSANPYGQPSVTIGGTYATNVSFVNSTNLTATTPAHAAGAANVVVTNYDGQASTLTNGYTFNAPPIISSVSPTSAKLTGGDTITISGSGFYGAPTITFGGIAATNITVLNSSTITVKTPAHAVGLVDIVITNPDSQTSTLTNGFTFTELPPTVASISPTNGPTGGGINMTITGANFLAGATVNIGGVAASNVVVVSPTRITATTSAHAPGDADVVVTNYDGQFATLSNAFNYHTWRSNATYTSLVKPLSNSGFGNISWNASIPANTSMTMRVKSCANADCSDKPSWTGCDLASSDNNTDISGKGCVVDGQGFVQYQAYLSTDSTTASPYLDSVTVSSQTQYSTAFLSLISSPFDSGDSNNSVQKITWSASSDNPAMEGSVQMQIRTAPDNGGNPDFSNSVWCGPTDCSSTVNSTSAFATSYYTDKTGATAINSVNRDFSNDRWIQYATFLKSADGTITPTISNVTLRYSFNTPPSISAVGFTQNSDGSVSVPYTLSETYDDFGSISHGVSGSPIKTLLVYQPKANVTVPAISNVQTGIITINNPGNMPIPSQGTMLIDDELISFDSAGATGNQRNITGRAQVFATSYPTFAVSHGANRPAFFLATRKTDGSALGHTIDTLNSTGAAGAQDSISNTFSWDAKNDPNLNLDGKKLTDIVFKVVANDADPTNLNNVGQSSATGIQTLDLESPKIKNLTSSTTDGRYNAGSNIDVTINFEDSFGNPKNVTSTGAVIVKLETGTNDYNCQITSITNSSSASCTYQVQAGDDSSDLTAISVSGIIKDQFANQLSDYTIPAGQNIADSKNIVIDTSYPIINSLDPLSNASINSTTAGSDISYDVSEALEAGSYIKFISTVGTDIGNEYVCSLQGAALNTGLHGNFEMKQGVDNCAESQTGLVNGSSYSLMLHAVDAAGNVKDRTNTDIVFDTSNPNVDIVSPSNNGLFNNVSSSSDISYDLSEKADTGTYIRFTRTGGSADASSPRTCNLTGAQLTQGSHANVDLDAVCGGFSLVDGAIYSMDMHAVDLAGNEGDASQKTNITFDTTAPNLLSFTSDKANNTPATGYGKGEVIDIKAVYDGPLESGSTITVRLDNAAVPAVDVVLDQISGNTLSGTFTVDGPMKGYDTTDLTLKSIVSENVIDAAGNVRSNSAIPSGQNLGNNKDIAIDTGTPILSGFQAKKLPENLTSGSYKDGTQIAISAQYSKPIMSGSITIHLNTNNGSESSTDVLLSSVSGDKISGIYTVAPGDNADDLKVAAITAQNATDFRNNILDKTGTVAAYDAYFTSLPGASIPAITNISNLQIDTTAPTFGSAPISIENSGGKTGKTNPNITLSASDNFNLSDGKVYFSLNGGTSWCTPSIAYTTLTSAFDITSSSCGGDTTNGTKTVTVKFQDAAGNDSINASDQVEYDTSNPQILTFSTDAVDGTYGPGSNIKIIAHYDENISGGNLTISLNNGKQLTLDTVEGGNNLVKIYTVGATDSGEDIDKLKVSSIILQSVSDTSSPANTQDGTSVAGITSNIDDVKAITIDTKAPSASSPNGSLTLDRASEDGKVRVAINPYDGGIDMTGMTAQIKLFDTDSACDFAGATVESFTSFPQTFTYNDSSGDVKQVCVKFTDKVGNQSSQFSVITPITPQNFKYTDLTGGTFVGSIVKWDKVTDEGTGGFKQYNLLRCETSGCTPAPNQVITSKDQNYFVFDDLVRGNEYCYAVTTQDANDDLSKVTSPVICGKAGDGPIPSSTDTSFENDPFVAKITKTSAYVIFKTINSNDNSPLATTASVEIYSDEDLTNLVKTVTDNFSVTHAIQMTGLDPGTAYYLKITATDTSIASNPNRTEAVQYDKATPDKYSFTTAGALSAINIFNQPSIVTDTKAVIDFTTDQNALCFIDYKEHSVASYNAINNVLEVEAKKNHSIVLSPLLSEREYDYKVTCYDDADKGNIITVGEAGNLLPSFTTLPLGASAGSDKTAPEISSVAITNLTGESATISWTTNELANSLVLYETEGATYTMVAGDAKSLTDADNYMTSHSVTLNNLIPATKYLFNVMSSDNSGNIKQSIQESFTTKEPSSLSSIKVVSTALGQATITWSTGVPSSSDVEYGLSTSYGQKKTDSSKTKEHQIILSGLSPGEVYHFRVKGQDDQGNIFSSSDITFQPKSPPKISDFHIDRIFEHGGTVIFNTNVPTDALITYADVTNPENTGLQGNPSITAKHEIKLKDLTSGGTFSLKVKVKDEDGNETEETFPNMTTSKDETAPVIENIKTDSALTQNDKVQSIISWNTDEVSTGKIIYREGKNGEEKTFDINGIPTLSHIAVLTAFKPGVVYYFNIVSTDPSGNKSVSSDYGILTPKKTMNIIQIIINNFQQIFGWARM